MKISFEWIKNICFCIFYMKHNYFVWRNRSPKAWISHTIVGLLSHTEVVIPCAIHLFPLLEHLIEFISISKWQHNFFPIGFLMFLLYKAETHFYFIIVLNYKVLTCKKRHKKRLNEYRKQHEACETEYASYRL